MIHWDRRRGGGRPIHDVQTNSSMIKILAYNIKRLASLAKAAIVGPWTPPKKP